MPAITETADIVVRLPDDGQNFRMLGQTGREGMNIEGAEAGPEGQVLLGSNVLIAKEYDLMIDQRLFDGGKLRIGKLR